MYYVTTWNSLPQNTFHLTPGENAIKFIESNVDLHQENISCGLWNSVLATTTELPDFKNETMDYEQNGAVTEPKSTAQPMPPQVQPHEKSYIQILNHDSELYGGSTTIKVNSETIEVMHDIVQTASGEDFYMALTRLGEVLTWGQGAFGQLGHGSSVGSLHRPKAVSDLTNVHIVHIAAGAHHWLAVSNTGDVYSCGSGSLGKLGTGNLSNVYLPTKVKALLGQPVFLVAAGDNHSAVLTTSGELFTFGSNKHGQLGIESFLKNKKRPLSSGSDSQHHSSSLPVLCNFPNQDKIIDVKCGRNHTIVLTQDHKAITFGQGDRGQLGNRKNVCGMHQITALEKYMLMSLSGGAEHSLALTTCGKLFMWGTLHDDSSPLLDPVQITFNYSKESTISSMNCIAAVSGAFHNIAVWTRDQFIPQTGLSRKNTIYCLTPTQIPSTLSEMASAFSSMSVLSNSFIRYNDDQVDVLGDEAESVYSMLMIQKAEIGLTLLVNAAEKIVEELEVFLIFSEKYFKTKPSGVNNLPHISFYFQTKPNLLILFLSSMLAMMNPAFSDPGSKKALGFFQRLTDAMGTITKMVDPIKNKCKPKNHPSIPFQETSLKKLIETIARGFSADVVEKRFLEPLHHLIATELTSSRRITDTVVAATRIIGLFFQASDFNEPEGFHLSRDKFYSTAVSDMVDMRQDYERWNNNRTLLLMNQQQAKSKNLLFCFCDYPFILNEYAKAKLLHIEAQNIMEEEILRSVWLDHQFDEYCCLSVRRDHIIQDTTSLIFSLDPRDLKKPLKIIFQGEPGIDEGGVKKEYFQILSEKLFDPNYGMFTYDNENHYHWFARNSLESTNLYSMIGTLVGMAIHNELILDLKFPQVVYKKLLGEKPNLQDLKAAFPELGQSLQKVLDYEGDDLEDVFCLTYSVNYMSVLGDLMEDELVLGGKNKNVTQQNKLDFVSRYVQYKLETSIQSQFDAFEKGFKWIISGATLQLLVPEELEVLLCGEKILDFNVLKESTRYEGGYTENSRAVKWLWEILLSLDEADKRKFLSFTTGNDRCPVGGLGKLKMIIQRAGLDNDRLPTSHTCFNVLILPDYGSSEKMRKLLFIAINNAQGFGLQ